MDKKSWNLEGKVGVLETSARKLNAGEEFGTHVA